MKNINITKKTARQIKKEVCLGNGNTISFNSKRQAGYFIAETNRFLTKCLVILNETFIAAMREYRLFWLVSSNANNGTTTDYTGRQHLIRGNLQHAENMMDKFSKTNVGSNDQYFAFIDLNKAAFFLNEALGSLEKFNRDRNLTANAYSCMILAERCLLIIKNLQEYNYVK